MSLFSKFSPGGFALAVALLLSAQSLSAGNYLIVNFNDGSSTGFDISYRPDVSFQGDRMVVDGKTVTADYAIADVKTFSFVLAVSGIVPPVAANEVRLTYTDPDLAVVSGMAPATPVAVFSVSGIRQMTVTADATGEASLNLASLPQGVYLITISNGPTFKIAR